ncbi:hypothetical protein LTR04_001767 [Oleoguttula sp. CCFEE 6159]|nr:hypothetical protein LTR04_001767 [Oleoguttula sp. CCFEE 6159]
MTSVWSVSEKVQPKMRSRRKMTEHEKVEYRQRRVMRACENCSKRKRKCHHNQPDTDAVQATKKASAKKRSKDSAKPTGINTATAAVTSAAFSPSAAVDHLSAFQIPDMESSMSFTDDLGFADLQPFDLQTDAFTEFGALFPQHDMSIPTWHDTTHSPIPPTGYESMSRQSSSSSSELFANGRSQSSQCSSGSPGMLTRQNTLFNYAGMDEFINHDFVLFDDVNDQRFDERTDVRAPAALGIARAVDNANIVGGENAAATPPSIHGLARESQPGTIARPSRPPRTLVQNDLHMQVQDPLAHQSFELRTTGSTVFSQVRSEQSTTARQSETHSVVAHMLSGEQFAEDPPTLLAHYKRSGVASDQSNNAQALASTAAHGHASVEEASSSGAISSPQASAEIRKSGIKAFREGGQGSARFTVHINKHASQIVSDTELAPWEVARSTSAAPPYFSPTDVDSRTSLEYDDSSPQARVSYSRVLREDLSLLSLDGGGVRGISPLSSMKRMMQMTEFAASLTYFSLMGSSIGGLVAVMALEHANSLADAASNGALNIRRRFGPLLWPDSPIHRHVSSLHASGTLTAGGGLLRSPPTLTHTVQQLSLQTEYQLAASTTTSDTSPPVSSLGVSGISPQRFRQRHTAPCTALAQKIGHTASIPRGDDNSTAHWPMSPVQRSHAAQRRVLLQAAIQRAVDRCLALLAQNIFCAYLSWICCTRIIVPMLAHRHFSQSHPVSRRLVICSQQQQQGDVERASLSYKRLI